LPFCFLFILWVPDSTFKGDKLWQQNVTEDSADVSD
jgi:hypothetical protein